MIALTIYKIYTKKVNNEFCFAFGEGHDMINKTREIDTPELYKKPNWQVQEEVMENGKAIVKYKEFDLAIIRNTPGDYEVYIVSYRSMTFAEQECFHSNGWEPTVVDLCFTKENGDEILNWLESLREESRIVAMSFCEPRSCIGRLSS